MYIKYRKETTKKLLEQTSQQDVRYMGNTEKSTVRNSLEVQWLGSALSLPRPKIQSLVEEPRSPNPWRVPPHQKKNLH